MIAKNIKGKSFGGCVRYVMNDSSELLEAEGVFADSAESIVRSFAMQRANRSEIKQPVGHIPLAFAPEDKARMNNEFMLLLAKEYMKEMGIGNTQYIIVRHHNTDHDHLHIVYNRIDNDLKLISANNDYKSNIAVCKKLKDRYQLTYGKGKAHVNRPNLYGADKAKYAVYDAMKEVLPKSADYQLLAENLKPHGITIRFKCRRGTDIIEGVSFEKDDYTFKGSQIDRKFSHKNLMRMFAIVKAHQNQWSDARKSDKEYNPQIHAQNLVQSFGKNTSNVVSDSLQPVSDAAAEVVSTIGGLLDIPFDANPAENIEEAEFRRLMQRRKKKGRRL
jgi:hypothetical protein